MTQQETFEVLKENGGWMTIKQISLILKQGTGSICSNLNKLEKSGDVVKIEQNSLSGGNIWKTKK